MFNLERKPEATGKLKSTLYGRIFFAEKNLCGLSVFVVKAFAKQIKKRLRPV